MTLLDYQLPSSGQDRSPWAIYAALALAGLPLFFGVGGTICTICRFDMRPICLLALVFSFASVPLALIFMTIHAVTGSPWHLPGRATRRSVRATLFGFALAISVWPAAYACIRLLDYLGLMA